MTELITEEQARALIDQIKAAVTSVRDLIIEAWTKEAWKPLGYASWDDLCDTEFSVRLAITPTERQREVVALRDAGMSVRAIGSALRVGKSTVGRALPAPVPSGTPAPVKAVKGTDAKTYPATKPKSPPPPPPTSPKPKAVPQWQVEQRRAEQFEQLINDIVATADYGVMHFGAQLVDLGQVPPTLDLQVALLRGIERLVKAATYLGLELEQDKRMAEAVERLAEERIAAEEAARLEADDASNPVEEEES